MRASLPVATIDRIMREAAGFRMGPFELMDLTGIDVNLPATRVVYEGFQHDPRLKTTALHESLFAAGRSDARAAAGFTITREGRAASTSDGDDASVTRGSARRLSLGCRAGAQGLEILAERGLTLVTAAQAEVILVSPAAGRGCGERRGEARTRAGAGRRGGLPGTGERLSDIDAARRR